MLKELTIRDYAIIGNLTLRFTQGLNILTGETGAGKSIIVGALGFLLGERVTEDVIRKGADRCWVEGVFEISPELTDEFLTSGLISDRHTTMTIRREIKRGGRTRAWINGAQISLQSLRKAGELLVDFHGQHEHQLLLKPERHVRFLDAFAGLAPLRKEVVRLRKDYLELTKKKRELEALLAKLTRERDAIEYEIEELEKLNLKEGEDVRLEKEIRILENAERILEYGGEILVCLYDSDNSAISLISTARRLLEKLTPLYDTCESLAKELEQAEVTIAEVANQVREELSSVELDPEELEQMRQRLHQLEFAKRKYGETIEGLIARLKRLKSTTLEESDLKSEVEALNTKIEKTSELLTKRVEELTQKRKRAARRFEARVVKEMVSLGFKDAVFRVLFEPVENGVEISLPHGGSIKVSEDGQELAEFFIRTNPGEDILPLRRIASGGEISRVMLGLKKILADVDEVGTLVFDEIDAGIGGSTAGIVARKLCEVSSQRQVLCITHLAQIAAQGDVHFKVVKKTSAGRTIVDVKPVEGEERVREIARMLSGEKMSPGAIRHAREILSVASTDGRKDGF